MGSDRLASCPGVSVQPEFRPESPSPPVLWRHTRWRRNLPSGDAGEKLPHPPPPKSMVQLCRGMSLPHCRWQVCSYRKRSHKHGSTGRGGSFPDKLMRTWMHEVCVQMLQSCICTAHQKATGKSQHPKAVNEHSGVRRTESTLHSPRHGHSAASPRFPFVDAGGRARRKGGSSPFTRNHLSLLETGSSGLAVRDVTLSEPIVGVRARLLPHSVPHCPRAPEDRF